MTALLDRFLRYVRIDTQSSETSGTFPSTPGQWDLLRLLFRELKELGLSDVRLNESGYVLATIPATSSKKTAPALAFLAHVDTAKDFSGTGVKPVVHENYSGGRLNFPADPQLLLDPAVSPDLSGKIGCSIVTAAGDTLLGADDKAGVAIVMTFAEELLRRKVSHGPIRLCFNPDEEIGRGMEKLSLEELGAKVAYTLDACGLGQIQYETFSAKKAAVTISGCAVHPGHAKGKLVNALRLAALFISKLPNEGCSPETTEGREGFLHPYVIEGNAAQARLSILLRDFELEGLRQKEETVRKVCDELGRLEPRARIECTFQEQYRNMRYEIERDMRPVEFAERAMHSLGITPIKDAVRGGTDGSALTARGLPTPNIFCGSHEAHGPLEWVAVEDMEKAVAVLLELVQIWDRES